jgi:Xaa-Pro aminopeptidase
MKHPFLTDNPGAEPSVAARAVMVVAMFLAAVSTLVGGVAEREYATRRGAVEAALDSTSVVIFRAADMKMRSADTEYRYRQESNLLYLTGIDELGITFILTGRGVQLDGITSTRFLLAGAGVRKTIEAAGVLKDVVILDAGRLPEILALVLHGRQTLYLSMPDIPFVSDWLNNRPMFLDRDVRKELERRFAGLKVKSAAPVVARLREFKSPAEIGLISKSIAVTGDGMIRAMRASAPGVFEYELQAALEYEMTRQGAAYVGFPSIIGSGPNSLSLHYSVNRRQMRDGEIVVMDVGAEMEGYSADVTRSFPVNGLFSSEQRQVYTAVLEAQKAAIAAVRPGVTFAELDAVARASLARSGFAKYLTHGISHHLGLDTHDVGSVDTIRAGMVITVEPGAYIPASDTTLGPAFRGWGIRIEDDVLVTVSGNVVLSSSIPKEIEEIERIMRK